MTRVAGRGGDRVDRLGDPELLRFCHEALWHSAGCTIPYRSSKAPRYRDHHVPSNPGKSRVSPATIMGPPFRHESGTTSSPFVPADTDAAGSDPRRQAAWVRGAGL